MGASGLSPARLGRLREALARHVTSGEVPGLVGGMTSPGPPEVFRDFWTAAYAAIGD
jgi:hypothetical protein